ncbi:hypothetical protein [Nocardia brasiliensis]|nr:hypothetical protein [Nocardia brasiliensis]MBF6128220.1 hypothetical protein [Nocardia brasiliensis]
MAAGRSAGEIAADHTTAPGGHLSPASPIDGTASTHLIRLVRDTARLEIG